MRLGHSHADVAALGESESVGGARAWQKEVAVVFKLIVVVVVAHNDGGAADALRRLDEAGLKTGAWPTSRAAAAVAAYHRVVGDAKSAIDDVGKAEALAEYERHLKRVAVGRLEKCALRAKQRAIGLFAHRFCGAAVALPRDDEDRFWLESVSIAKLDVHFTLHERHDRRV